MSEISAEQMREMADAIDGDSDVIVSLRRIQEMLYQAAEREQQITLENALSRHVARVAELGEQHAAMVAKLRELARIGGLLSNCAYNLAQSDTLTDRQRASLDETRKAWDAAIADELKSILDAEPATPVKVDAEDTERLEWLMHHTSGKTLREIGVNANGANWRDAIDVAMRKDTGEADTVQKWTGMDVATACSLIASHANNWNLAG